MPTWLIVSIGLLCFAWGVVIGSMVTLRVGRRLTKRLNYRRDNLKEVLELEARRNVHDNPRRHIPRHSGSPAKVHSAKQARSNPRPKKPELP